MAIKALIIGLGSAGQRHVRNLKRILGDDVILIAYRVSGRKLLLDDSLQAVCGKDIVQEYNIEEFWDFDDALSQKPDIAIVANPSSMHVYYSIKLAESGVDFLVEKPVATSLEDIDTLLNAVRSNRVTAMVGYQMRWHPCIQRLCRELDSERIGDIIGADWNMGEDLKRVHPYQDYHDMVEAHDDKGGGVIMVQTHEMDILCHIFGQPLCVSSIGGHFSDMDIDVEDNVTSLCMFRYKDKNIPVVLHQDMIQDPPVRKYTVMGTEGTIECDVLNHQIFLTCGEKKEVQTYGGFDRNMMFIEEMKYFLNVRSGKERNVLTIEEGLKSLRMALAIKESMVRNEKVVI